MRFLRLNHGLPGLEMLVAWSEARQLGLADAKDLGATGRADPLSGRASVFQRHRLWTRYFPLAAALEAVSFHANYPPVHNDPY